MKNHVVFLFLCLSLLAPLAYGMVQENDQYGSRLDALVTVRGEVPVIVTMDVDNWRTLSRQSATASKTSSVGGEREMAAAALVKAITGVADGVRRSLPAGSFTQKRQYTLVPAMALTVNETGLRALAANSSITGIYEDKLHALPPITINQPAMTEPVPDLLNESAEIIGAADAWAEGYTGKGIHVAILDTGVRTSHEMFTGKDFVEACFSTTLDGYYSTTVCPNGLEAQVGPGAAAPNAGSHGTHVAGIAAGNNPGYSAGEAHRGVAPEADIIAVQVFSKFSDPACSYFGLPAPCYLSYDSDQLAGLEFVYSLRSSFTIGAVNMSLGGGSYDAYCDTEAPLTTVIDNLRTSGIATVIATGNNGYCGSVASPSCISSAIAVGATEQNDTQAAYSNYHSALQDLFAPGSAILSATAQTDQSYASWNGTSMATPHVAGVFTLLRQVLPGSGVNELESALLKTGTKITDSCTGAPVTPRINVGLAMQYRRPSPAEKQFPWILFQQLLTSPAID